MATLDTVARIVRGLPETAETSSAQGLRWWRVKTKTIAWERPLRRSDLAALGSRAPKRLADEWGEGIRGKRRVR